MLKMAFICSLKHGRSVDMQSLKRGEICPEAQRKTKCIHLYHWNSVYTRGEWEVKSLQ